MSDQAQDQTSLQIAVHAQYIRDFSFESPSAPQVFSPSSTQPNIEMGVNVQTRPLEKNNYEVVLMIKLEAKTETSTAFIAELAYAGVFGMPAMPEEQLKMFLLIEAPRLLFPFARNIIANAVRDGGFPQVLVNPIDFGALYQAQQVQMNAPAQGTA
ncbi:MAG: protein-export chaperone SecB [Alphaproteobacteria bacterium]|nr:protein-export chaperone SecB [Alphaproteobacteria bacterium]